MKIKKFIRDITGITAREEQAKAEELKRLELVKRANESLKKEKAELRKKAKEEKLRKQAEEDAKLTPKELATKRKEPWVDARLNVTKNSVRYGFYDIDWNEYWILQLKQEGYGVDGDPDEAIIDRWLRDISASVAAEEGIDMSERDMGYINIVKRDDGKSEVS
jgi:hypothetical protein